MLGFHQPLSVSGDGAALAAAAGATISRAGSEGEGWALRIRRVDVN